MSSKRPEIGPTPVFMVGMIKKVGTNYLHRLLRLHPGCAAYPVDEDYFLHFLGELEKYSLRLDRFYSKKKRHELERLARPDLDVLRASLDQSLGLGVIRHINRVAGARGRRVLLKTPTIYGAENFFRFFEGAPLIVLVRDGRATVQSMRRWTGEPLERCAKAWAEAAARVLEVEKIAAAENGRLLVVKYEDLYSSTRSELRRVFKFLDLSPRDYPFERAETLPVTYSSFFNEKGSYHLPKAKTEAFSPLENFSDWTGKERRAFESIAGKALKALGY